MSQYQVGIIVGSLRKDSINRRLAKALIALAPADVAIEIIEIADVPLYNQDHDADMSAGAKAFKAAVASKDGIIFATPEYNRSIPGVLKNAIDTGTRPYGNNSWTGKAAGIVGASPGAIGTAVAQAQLRSIVACAMGMALLAQPEVYLHFNEGLIDADGVVGNDKTRAFLQGWLDTYVAWVKKIKA